MRKFLEMLPGIKYFLDARFYLWRAPLQIEAEILSPLNQKESSSDLQRVSLLGTPDKHVLS